MPRGDSNRGRVAKFLGHAWEVVYQALFCTSNKKLPLIQFPRTRDALNEFLAISKKLTSELKRKTLEQQPLSYPLFKNRLTNYLKAQRKQGKYTDCLVNERQALGQLKRNFGIRERIEKISLKSGANYQIHSGRMDVISKSNKGQPSPSGSVFKKQIKHLKSKKFWNDYMGKKGELLVVVDPSIRWRHYLMRDVVKALAENTIWHRTSDGRIKGKLPFIHIEKIKRYVKITPAPRKIRGNKQYTIEAKKLIKYQSVITIERKGSSLLFAANGNCAQKMCAFLDQNIHYKDISRASVADLGLKKKER